MEHYAWTVALTRMISAIFRRGGDISFVVEELKAVFDPSGGAWMNGKYVPSLLAAIGDIIEQHLVHIGFADADGSAAPAAGSGKTLVESGGSDTGITRSGRRAFFARAAGRQAWCSRKAAAFAATADFLRAAKPPCST